LDVRHPRRALARHHRRPDRRVEDASCETIIDHPVEIDPVVDFPWYEPGDCEPSGVCQITEADNATVGETKTYTGYAARKDGFFAYHVVAEHPEDGEDRVLLLAARNIPSPKPRPARCTNSS
jgi:hypothetical protein